MLLMPAYNVFHSNLLLYSCSCYAIRYPRAGSGPRSLVAEPSIFSESGQRIFDAEEIFKVEKKIFSVEILPHQDFLIGDQIISNFIEVFGF